MRKFRGTSYISKALVIDVKRRYTHAQKHEFTTSVYI